MIPTPYQVVSQLKQPVQLNGNCRTNQEMLERNHGIRHDVSFMAKPLQYQSPSISRGLSAPLRSRLGSNLHLVMKACRVGGPLLLQRQFPRNGIYFWPRWNERADLRRDAISS